MRGRTRIHPAALSGAVVALLAPAAAASPVPFTLERAATQGSEDENAGQHTFLTWTWTGVAAGNISRPNGVVSDVEDCVGPAAFSAASLNAGPPSGGQGFAVFNLGRLRQDGANPPSGVRGIQLANLNFPLTGGGPAGQSGLPAAQPAGGGGGGGGSGGAGGSSQENGPGNGNQGNGTENGNPDTAPPQGSPEFHQIQLVLLPHLPRLGTQRWEDFCHLDDAGGANTDAVAIPLPAPVWMGLAGLVTAGLLRRRRII